MAFKMKGHTLPGINQRSSAFTKKNPTKNLKGKIKGAITSINTKLKSLKKSLDVKLDQVPYVGPSTSIYSTLHKARNPHRFPKATINQPGYENIKKKIIGKKK